MSFDPNEAQSRVLAAQVGKEVENDQVKVGSLVTYSQYVPDVGFEKYEGEVVALGNGAAIIRTADEDQEVVLDNIEVIGSYQQPIDSALAMKAQWLGIEDLDAEIVKVVGGKIRAHSIKLSGGKLTSQRGGRKQADYEGNIEGKNEGYYVLHADGTVASGPHANWWDAMVASRGQTAGDTTNPTPSGVDVKPASRKIASDFSVGDSVRSNYGYNQGDAWDNADGSTYTDPSAQDAGSTLEKISKGDSPKVVAAATDLGEFVSDYLSIEGAENDSNYDIAMAYLDQNMGELGISEEELELAVMQYAQQIAYYTGKNASKVAGYCRNCSGRGRLINGDTCPDCKGTGKDDNPEAEAKIACTEHDYDENGKCKNCGKQKEGSLQKCALVVGDRVQVDLVDEGGFDRRPNLDQPWSGETPTRAHEGELGTIVGDQGLEEGDMDPAQYWLVKLDSGEEFIFADYELTTYLGTNLASKTAEHDCLADIDNNMEYEGSISAPGWGDSFKCKICGHPWIRHGYNWVDPTTADISDIEMSIEDVI